jgi:integrase/recombinase XerD
MRTIQEHLAAFADDLTLRNYSARTASDYGYSLRSLATFLEQRIITDVAAITTANLTDFQRWLYHQPTRHGVARGVCHQNAVLAAVRSFFRFLRREGYVIRDPAAELEYAKEPRRLPRNILTTAEARRIIEAPDTGTTLGVRDRAILETLYATGLRSAELRGVRIADVNLEEELLRVNGGKGGHDRVVPIGAHAAKWIETYANAIRPQLARARGQSAGSNERLFLSANGRPIDPHTLGDIVKRYAKLARVKKHVTCHVWRHTCATHLIQNRANVRHVQEMLGHRSLSTTERYLWLTIADLKEAHAKFHPRERTK